MPFMIRSCRRFPVTYYTGLSYSHGTICNLSLTGWRFSGNLPAPYTVIH